MAAPDDPLKKSDEPVSSLFVVGPAPVNVAAPLAAPTTKLETIRKRVDFVASSRGNKARSPAFLIQLRPGSTGGPLRFGFTVTNKCGNAPERNRMRRRLRAAIRMLLPEITGGGDFVIVARRDVLTLPQARLMADLSRGISALIRKCEPQIRET